ncbi:MAG: enoyl-CoA hydratase/isomerase family protein [Candidatus Cyclobacteriaceae bacterium M3_2C_046]
MAELQTLKLEIEEGILIIQISRPDKLNALNTITLEELRTTIQSAYDDKDIKGVIITGEGDKAFVSGADIDEIAGLNELNGRKFSENGQEVFALIENCPKPIIAAVNGYALGGGCELAMACHIRVATKNATFGLPEVTLGMIPGYGGTQRLTQLIGKGKALELMMTAEVIGAEEALNLRLINYLVRDKAELLEKSKQLLTKIISNAPLAVGMLVECVNAVYNFDENGYQTESNSFSNCFKSSDFQEGVNAFIEKRKPKFEGE